MSRDTSPYARWGAINPLSDARLEQHEFAEGESLSGLADFYYADWRLWRVIAERNKIADARRIEPGTILLIPERPLQVGVFESA